MLESHENGDGEVLELCSVLESTTAHVWMASGECEGPASKVESLQLPGEGTKDVGFADAFSLKARDCNCIWSWEKTSGGNVEGEVEEGLACDHKAAKTSGLRSREIPLILRVFSKQGPMTETGVSFETASPEPCCSCIVSPLMITPQSEWVNTLVRSSQIQGRKIPG